MPYSISIKIQVPSAAAFADFCTSYGIRSSSAIIAVAYSLVLHRFFDIRSYVYEKTESDSEVKENGRSKQTRRCLVALEPESGLLEAIQAVQLDEGSDDLGDHETARHLAFQDPEGMHDGSGDPQYAIGLVITGESKSDDGTDNVRTAVLDFCPSIYSDFQGHNMAQAISQALHIITSSTVDVRSTCLFEVDLFSPQDYHTISKWTTDRFFVSQQNIPNLVEKTCAQHPSQTAVMSSFDGSSLTYSRLNKLSNRLGKFLIKKYGIGRGAIVPICLDKSTLAVMAMLAIWKTGAAYCCLDPQHPQARHDFIIESVKAPFVLASSQYASMFSLPVLALDSALVQQLDQEDEDESIKFEKSQLEDTCIVVFSSGSTGVPKGIVHTHQTFATGLIQNGSRHGLDRPGIRVFQWCAYTFDISLTEIWGPLICGGVVCIPSEEERLNDVEVPMNRMGVEWAFFTPSFARFYCRQQYCVEKLKTLVVGGEALTQEDARAFLEGMDLDRVIHLFGPAELITQFLKTLTPRTSSTHSSADNVPFIPSNAHCWIVDPDDTDRLAPIGAVGELLIEGPALFTGYLNDSARNKVAFVKSPQWRAAVAGGASVYNIYRSGDLVRHVGNGEIRYVSRKDGVVKLRGQFVDLAEIESILRASLSLDDIALGGNFGTEACVLLVKDIPAQGDQALVTFLCIKDTNMLPQDRMLALSTTAPALQTLLRKKLPEYMLPRLFYALEKFPYNASGKLDRKTLALSASALSMDDLFQLSTNLVDEPDSSKHVQNPLTIHDEQTYKAISTLLRKAWIDVFGLCKDDIAQHNDFFQQGGNSMRAMELVAAARRSGVSISVAKVFANPTFDRLVAVANLRVDSKQSAEEASNVPPFSLLGPMEEKNDVLKQVMEQCRDLDMSEMEDVLPTTPLQAEFMAGGLAYPGCFIAQTWFTIPAGVSLDRFQAIWKQLIDGFATMRCRIVQTTKYGAFQVVLNAKRPSTWIKLADGIPMSEYLTRDRATPMGYGEALVRYAFFGSGEGVDHHKTVVLTMHQAIYDGFTVKRIERALNDLLNGRVDATRDVAVFTPFIKEITLQSDRKVVRSFWQDYLDGFGTNNSQNKPFPALPTPTYATRADSLFATNVQFPAMTAGTRPGPHITLPTIVLAAWALVINHYKGNHDIVFPVHISGRGLPVPGIMDMAFPTIASVPVRIQLPSQLVSSLNSTASTVDRHSNSLVELQEFLQQVQATQIQLATTVVGHAGFATIATYSDSCRRAVEVCENYPLGNVNIQYATATWRPKPSEEHVEGNDAATQEQLSVEFQVDRNDAKYFSPGDALSLGCYILGYRMVRLVVVYDSKVVREEQVAEYAAKTGEFIRVFTASLA